MSTTITLESGESTVNYRRFSVDSDGVRKSGKG